ncbi:MAG: UbiA family prenyltransferase [Nocardioides sp.]
MAKSPRPPSPGDEADASQYDLEAVTSGTPVAGGAPEASASLRGRLSLPWSEVTAVTLLQAAHPRQALATALAIAVAALAAGRPLREVGVVAATVLAGQTILGWHNDLVDRERDARHATVGKPLAEGRLDPGTAWYALAIAVLLVVPLSLSTGITAGICYLASLGLGLLSNLALRTGRFSWLLWAASFALLPAYLSYGGWGGDADGTAPQPLMVVLAALLGIGVHLVRSIWGLVADDRDDWAPIHCSSADAWVPPGCWPSARATSPPSWSP